MGSPRFFHRDHLGKGGGRPMNHELSGQALKAFEVKCLHQLIGKIVLSAGKPSDESIPTSCPEIPTLKSGPWYIPDSPLN